MSIPRRTRAAKAASQANGAVSTASSVKGVIAPDPQVNCPAAPRRHPSTPVTAKQTHGAVTSLVGPITSVSQLTNGGRNVAKGSAGSFETLGAYTDYLRGLGLHDLHRHAVEDARIVPIDDRERLIRRLETAWTTTSSKYPGRSGNGIPQRAPFTKDQITAQADIKRRLLRGLGA